MYITVQQRQDQMVFHFDYHMIFCHNNDYTLLHELAEHGTFRDFYLDLHKQSAETEKHNPTLFPISVEAKMAYLFCARINHTHVDILFMSIINYS